MKSFVRHPIFPLIILIFSVQLTGEHYPFSPFSMFANPSQKPHRLYFLANNDGDPLPTSYHIGMTAARITKMFKNYRDGMIEDNTGKHTVQEIEKIAGEKLLKYLIKIAHSRGEKRQLPLPLQLMEIEISCDDKGPREKYRMVMQFDS